MVNTKNRAKLGYLEYSEVIERIKNGELDAYDIVYTKDTHENLLISSDLNIIPINSRIYRFDDVESAEKILNENSDTYAGQIISILFNEAYVGYVVNKNYKGLYYVTPLSSDNGEIDYNKLGNKPITNLVGTLADPVIVNKLGSGIYRISGQYQLSQEDKTVYLSAVSNLFLVDNTGTSAVIKKISASDIYEYSIVNDVVIEESKVPTTKFLEDKGYATEEYVDAKIAALNFITKSEVEEYVTQLVINAIDDILDERIDKKIDEKILVIPDENISGLF